MTNEEALAFINKNRLSVGCGVLSLALIAGIYFRSSLIPETEVELAQKTAEADKHAANIRNSAQLKEQLDALIAANKEIDSRIIRAGQLGTNYQYFYKIIGESGVKQIDLRQTAVGSPAKGKTAFMPIGFTVAVQGDLSQIMHFLTLLESGARYCRVLGATSNVAGADRAGPITLNLTLELLGSP